MQLAVTLDRHSAFADGDDADRNFVDAIHQQRTAGIYQMAMVAAAFSHDKTMGSANTAASAVRGDGLIENKIGAHLKGLLHRGAAVDDGKGNATLVGFALAHFA